MSNPISNALPAILTLAEDMADGLKTYEVAVGVKQNTQAVLRGGIAALRAAESDFATAKSAKDTANTDVTVADSNAKAFLKGARAVLAKRYGETWNASWAQTGFPNQSTAVPRTQGERLNLCAALQTYFTKHPDHEVAGMDATAELAGQHFTALSTTRHAVDAALTESGEKRAARDAAKDALKTRMRGLIEELGQLLADTDPRWHAFGLNAPGDSDLPDLPDALVLTAAGPGSVLADWADARRATRYRVFAQIAGVDADFRNVVTRDESDATLTGLPSGKTVKIKVTAANDAGEGPASETKEIVVS